MSDLLSHKGSVRAPEQSSTSDTNYRNWDPSTSHYLEVIEMIDLKTSERKIKIIISI